MDYKRIRSDAEKEIAKLLADRQRIDARISALKTMVQNCLQLDGIACVPGIPIGEPVGSRNIPAMPGGNTQIVDAINEVQPDQGITNAIRQVLAGTKLPLSAPEIRSGVLTIGVDLSQYVNAAAVIHNTLTRLEKQGEVMRVVNPAGQTAAYALVKKNKAFYGEP